ncbi:MAG: 4-hydroxy-tetrahydrodipicolinate reductase, partial [Clostridia bacterium]|nr:4-hydroxy-tetrahydrodipicolinate reductase [Clostridia bacterium]
MIKIIMNGCNGKMGQVITKIVADTEDCEIVVGIDINDNIQNTYPVFKSIADFEGKADVIIDFSHPSTLTSVLDYAKATKTPAIICTTGLSAEQKAELGAASKEVAIFFSANMSLG